MILAISVLGRGRVALGTLSRLVLRRVLGRDASQNWRLSKTKSEIKWANQLAKGNWTPEKITNTLRNGKAYKAINKTVQPNRPATIYKLGNDFIVVDDVTNEVIQVSRPGFKPPYLQ